jgi:ribosomal protein S12 methylthiotransferase accessory factor
LSVTVDQGKGSTFPLAAISGLMESLEGWASERIASDRVFAAPFDQMNKENFWSHVVSRQECNETLSWIEGWDLFSNQSVPVPLAVVDTAYTVPSPHPHWIARDTTGLAAGTSLQLATLHACLEVLERHARCRALKTPHFFDRFQLSSRSVQGGEAGEILGRLFRAGFAVGVWAIPTEHGLPVYWCHIMEDGQKAPFAPLPAEGFGCDLTHDRALAKALLEACQSRLGVISAARDDIRSELYRFPDANELAEWRKQLATEGRPYVFKERSVLDARPLRRVRDALQSAGAKAAIVVILHSDEQVPLHVVKVVAPPLETNPEIDLGR